MSTLSVDALSCDEEYDVGGPEEPDVMEMIEMESATTSDTVAADIDEDPLDHESNGQTHQEIDGHGQSNYEIDCADNGSYETEFLDDTQHSLDEEATGESKSEIGGGIQSNEESLVKEDPFNIAMMQVSLDNSTNSEASDCIVTAAYYLLDVVDDTDSN